LRKGLSKLAGLTFLLAHNYEQLKQIEGMAFTAREIDVLACLISGKASKDIAEILSISTFTVNTHIQNMRKIVKSNSRRSIVSFVEKSGMYPLLRDHYTYLLKNSLFESELKKAKRCFTSKHLICEVIYWEKDKKYKIIAEQIKAHLKLTGLEVSLQATNKLPSNIFDNQQFPPVNHIVYVLPGEIIQQLNASSIPYTILQQAIKKVTFFLDESDLYRSLEENKYNLFFLNHEDLDSYYIYCIKLLRDILPDANIENIITILGYQNKNQLEKLSSISSQKLTEIKHLNAPTKKTSHIFRTKLKMGFLILCSLAVGFIMLSFFLLNEIPSKKNLKNNKIENTIRSELILPSRANILQRSNLINEIDYILNDKEEIQIAILSGMGGVGKTTVARQYAYQHNCNIIWEINAETKHTLADSFRSLAYALVKSEGDRGILNDIINIKDAEDREKNIMFFVKERMRNYSNWLLIYDNAKDFLSIKNYFPIDSQVWGSGKVIITTRDNNIQFSPYIKKESILNIGELSKEEAEVLFARNLYSVEPINLPLKQKKKLQSFLEITPPFPLDIIIAARYLKNTHTTYEVYKNEVIFIEEDIKRNEHIILRETGDYTKTRYGIITSALKEILNIDDEFKDLLLLMSLLDSQEIPKDFLYCYKEKSIVDRVIYNMKKYSFITKDITSEHTLPLFSLHRSTQAIILSYLLKSLPLSEKSAVFQYISNGLEKYINAAIAKQDIRRIKVLKNHLISLLNHSVIAGEHRENFEIQLGIINFYLICNQEAKNIFEKYINSYNGETAKDVLTLFKSLLYLGIIERESGNYSIAKIVLERAVSLARKHLPSNHKLFSLSILYLGIANRDYGNYLESKNLIEESLRACREHFPDDWVNIAQTLTYLGSVYKELSNYNKAKELIEESLNIYKNYFPKNYLGVARSLAHLGDIYIKFTDYQKAKSLLEESLEIYRMHYPECKGGIAWVLLRLGKLNLETAQYEKAKLYLEESHSIYAIIFGKEHIETARVLVELSKLYLQLNDGKAARYYIDRALEIFKKYNYPHSGTALNILESIKKN
jgi:DNA-binding CsgD family transcriptional regulator/Tfp pilus assembly protein PilF